jgi:hypothetical protein
MAQGIGAVVATDVKVAARSQGTFRSSCVLGSVVVVVACACLACIMNCQISSYTKPICNSQYQGKPIVQCRQISTCRAPQHIMLNAWHPLVSKVSADPLCEQAS